MLGIMGVAALLAVAAVLRAASLHFGLPALNDPDELMFELGAVRMLRGMTLNPGWFGHPATTTIYLLVLINILVFSVGWLWGLFPDVPHFGDAIYADPSWVILPGRAAMLVFGLVVILLAGRLAARLYGRCAAAITMLLLTFSPLHITLSQIIRSDMMACAFMLCVMLSAHRAIGTKGLRPLVPVALWLGLAVATKWPFVAAGCAGLGVGVARLIAAPRAAHGQVLSVMCGYVGLSLAALLCISPYLLLDYQTVLANLAGEVRPYHLGATGGGVLWNLRWYLTGPIWQALGPGGVLLALLGGWAIVDDQATRIILAPVLTGFVVILATQHLVWDRWALPVVVLLAILAGGGAARLVAHVPAAWARPAAMGLALIVALPLARAAQTAHHLRLHDTRQQATSWFARTAPANSRVLIEHFAWDLSPAPFRIYFPLGEAGCVDAKAMLRRKVGYQTVDLLRKGRSNVDIGTLPRAKLAACDIDYAIVTQADRYFAEQRRFPAEAANYAHLIKNSKTLAIFRPVPGVIGGPVVRVLQIRHIPASAR